MDINLGQIADHNRPSKFVHYGLYVGRAALLCADERFHFSFDNRVSNDSQKVDAFTNLFGWYYARYLPTFLNTTCSKFQVGTCEMLWDKIAFDVLSSFKKIAANGPNLEDLISRCQLMTQGHVSQEVLCAFTKHGFLNERLEQQAMGFGWDPNSLLCDANLAAAFSVYLEEFPLPAGQDKYEFVRDIIVSLYADFSLDGYANTPSRWFPRQREITKQFIVELASFLEQSPLPSDFPREEIAGWQASVLFKPKQAFW